MWMQGVALASFAPAVGLDEGELGFIPDPLFFPSTLGSQVLPTLHLEQLVDGQEIC